MCNYKTQYWDMVEAYFYLKNKNDKKKQLIFLGYNCGKNYFSYSTKFKVLPENWDFKTGRLKNKVKVLDRSVINKHLDELEEYVESISNQYKASIPRRELTRELLKIELESRLYPKVEIKITFFEFIKQYLDDCKSGKRLNEGKRMAERTIKNYNTGFNGLKEYEDYTKEPITFENLNRKFWDEYVNFLTMEKKYKVNTVGSYQKYLIVFLRECKKSKLWIDDDGLLDVAKVMTENPVDVYLTKKEIELIEKVDLSNNSRLDKIRDLFLIGLNTGFRVSDWYQVSNENIKVTDKENAYIEILQTKTRAIATTPLRQVVKDILVKYKNKLPVVSEQEINRSVKELCQLAGITQKVKITSTVGGGQQVEIFEKWEQVSTHTARRSFATNLYRDGVDSRIIMRATGHTTEKNFIKYLKLDNSEFMDMLAEHEG